MISPATLLLLASPLLAAAANHEGGGPAHRQRAAVARGASPAVELDTNETVELDKRGNTGANNARGTFYDTSVGPGSCGIDHPNSEFTVAVNSGQLNAAGGGYPNPLCGSTITISYNGKTAQATIQDECPTCPWGGLDLSMGLFSYFADQSVGVIYVDWWYGGGAAAEPTTTTPAWTPDPTTTTKQWVAPTTTTKAWTPDPTTTTKEWVAPTTTTPAWTPDPTTTSAAPTTTSTTAAPTTSSAAPITSSAAVSSAASSASEGDVAPSTISVKSATPTASSAIPVVNNLEALGSFANGLGRVVCNGNANCA